MYFDPSCTESPTIVMQSPEEVEVQVGEELRLFVEASCGAGGKLSFQWFRDSKKLNYGTSSELLVKRVRLEDQGTYSCRISSQHGGSCLTNSSQVTGQSGVNGERGVESHRSVRDSNGSSVD